MNVIELPPATETQVEQLWPAVRAAHLFTDREGLRVFRDAAPWRVRVDSRDRAVVVEQWRPHLTILSIRGLWAPGRDIPGIVAGIASLARTHAMTQVLSPLVTHEGSELYGRAGLTPCASLIALRSTGHEAATAHAPVPDGVGVRPGQSSDLEGLLAADHVCFDPFWAYGHTRLAEALAHERVTIAEENGELIGYTLCTVERGSGTLGRLGVVPDSRGRGVGASLLAESLRYMARAGASSVSLCTQEENADSRSLYARFGLRELPGRLELLIGDV